MIKRTGPVKSLLSILLTVSILFGITPLSAVSVPVVPETENVRQNPTEAFKAPDIIDAEEQAEKSYAGRVKEEEKDLYTFVFRNEDGSNTMRVFDHPVKYVDDKGETRDISLEISKDKDGSFKAADHMIKATFGNDLSEGIGLGYDGVRIKMTAKTVSGEKESVGLSSDGKKLTYAVDGKTSYVYSLTYCGIKEDIVVSEYTGQTEYEFTLNTNGLHPVKIDGSVFLADEEEDIRASIGDIIIFTADNRNNAFGELLFESVEENSEYRFTIVLDPDYLRDEKTVYPITIDPSITITGASNIEDVTIGSIGGMESLSSGSLYAGLGNSDGKLRFLMKFSSLSSNSIYQALSANDIISATINLRDLMCYTNKQIDLSLNSYASGYLPSTTWTNGCMSWSSVFTYDNRLTQIGSSKTVFYGNGNGANGQQWYAYDAKQLISKWKNGTAENYVAVFRTPTSTETGTLGNYLVFASSDRTTNKPYLDINYNTPANYSLNKSNIEIEIYSQTTLKVLNLTNDCTVAFVGSGTNDITITNNGNGECTITGNNVSGTFVNAYIFKNGIYQTTLNCSVHVVDQYIPDGYYYIKNASEDGYVDNSYPRYPIFASDRVMYTWEFDEYAHTYYIEFDNGYYKISYGANYLGVNDTDVDEVITYMGGIYTDFIRWKITKTETNNFKISPYEANNTNRVISLGEPMFAGMAKTIVLSDYTLDDDYSDEWEVFKSQTDYYNFLRGDHENDLNLSGMVSDIQLLCNNHSLIGEFDVNTTKDSILRHFKSSKICAFITHGGYDCILIDGTVNDGTLFYKSDLITATGWLDSSDLKHVYYLSCNSALGSYMCDGQPYTDVSNLSKETYDIGAQTVLGFNCVVNQTEGNVWSEYYLKAIYNCNMTLEDAIEAADLAVSALNFTTVNNSTRVLFGNFDVLIFDD